MIAAELQKKDGLRRPESTLEGEVMEKSSTVPCGYRAQYPQGFCYQSTRSPCRLTSRPSRSS
ncbi:MAG: hypothetical protein Q8K43_03955, partial [Sulfurimicrobium sp.]|nr:hypothetical protein [Sulfurimicrobium sp.]